MEAIKERKSKEVNENKRIQRLNSFVSKLNESEFRKELNDIISFGLYRYKDKYNQNKNQGVPFVLYEQYSRRDICFLMDCGKDLSSTREAELDLVKIAPTAKPPVCKIIDYGKYRYEQARKEKEAKKKQKTMLKNISMENLIMQMCLKTIKYSVGILRLEGVLIVLIRKM